MKGAGSPKEGEEGASEQDFEVIAQALGTAWETPEVELLHCGFPSLCTLLAYSQRDSEASVKLTGLPCGPQPLVWVLRALLHASLQLLPPAFHIGPAGLQASGYKSASASPVTVDQWNLEEHWHSRDGTANQAEESLLKAWFSSAVSVSES